MIQVRVHHHGSPVVSWFVYLEGPGGQCTLRNALDEKGAVAEAKRAAAVLNCPLIIEPNPTDTSQP